MLSRDFLAASSQPARRGLICALLGLGAGFFPTASAAPKTPAGTPVEARLLTPISSYAARPGLQIEAAVATPVCPGGDDALEAGAMLRGVVSKVHRVGLGLIHETAGIQLDFNELQLADGRVYPVQSQLTSIDNARESVDSHGKVHGIRATATVSNRIGQHLAFLALGHPAAMLPVLVMESAMFHFPEPEIELTRGADLHLAVVFPPEWGEVARCTVPEEISESEWANLHELVGSLPYWTYSKRQPQPMDIVNLVYVGSQDSITRAFTAAGWMGAQANSMHAGVKAIRAVAEEHALADAPMRTLLLDGAEPDLRVQKSLDTFAKRDHLRIWARDRELDGEKVWASAATRDTAAVFSIRPFGFTHRIQDDVDLERDQVVSDLAFTGCVDSVAYVSRPDTVRTSGESFRKGMFTDSRVAVIKLNSCEQPAQNFSDVGEMPQPPKMVRWIRRFTLTARNHYMRDNIVWRSGEAVRMAFHTVKGWRQEWKDERHAQELDAKLAARRDLRQEFAILR
jgi:LssY C-terminus